MILKTGHQTRLKFLDRKNIYKPIKHSNNENAEGDFLKNGIRKLLKCQ